MLEEGRKLDAQRALKLGFVDVVVDDVWTSTGQGRSEVLSCERGPELLLQTAKAEAWRYIRIPSVQSVSKTLLFILQ